MVSIDTYTCLGKGRIKALEEKPSIFSFLKPEIVGLPWRYSGYESACQCSGHRFDPWSRKIPHAAGATMACVPPLLNQCSKVQAHKRSHRNEKSMHCNQRVAPALQTARESPCIAAKAPCFPGKCYAFANIQKYFNR